MRKGQALQESWQRWVRGAEAGRSQGAGRPARRAPAPQTVPGAGVQVNLELAAPNQEVQAD